MAVCEVQIAGSVFVSQHSYVCREEHVGAICESAFASMCRGDAVCVLVCAGFCIHRGPLCVCVSTGKAVCVLILNTGLFVHLEDDY